MDVISKEAKSIVIPTTHAGMGIILNKKELQHLYRIIDHADNEIKTLSLLELFK